MTLQNNGEYRCTKCGSILDELHRGPRLNVCVVCKIEYTNLEKPEGGLNVLNILWDWIKTGVSCLVVYYWFTEVSWLWVVLFFISCLPFLHKYHYRKSLIKHQNERMDEKVEFAREYLKTSESESITTESVINGRNMYQLPKVRPAIFKCFVFSTIIIMCIYWFFGYGF